MSSCQEPLLKSDEEDELVFDRTGLLSNKVTIKPDIRQRGHTSGRRLQYARTVNLCLAFFALGLCFAIPTATLRDLQRAVDADLSEIEFIYTARYSGYVFGALIGGILFDRYNRQFLLFLSLLATAIGIITIPFCTKLGILMTCTAITGITMGFLDTGGNVWCLDLWGKKSAPFMQTMHFCFGLGAFIAPLVAEPFLSPHVENYSSPVNHINGNKTMLNFIPVRFPHQRYSSQHQISNIFSKYINDSEIDGISSIDEFRSSRSIDQIDQHFTIWKKNNIQETFLKLTVDKREIVKHLDEENTMNLLSENYNRTEESNITSDTNATYGQNFSSSEQPYEKSESRITLTTDAANTKHKPKKPFYADGNQLSQDNRWFRSSLKSKTQKSISISDFKLSEEDTVTTATTSQTQSTLSAEDNSTVLSNDLLIQSANESREESLAEYEMDTKEKFNGVNYSSLINGNLLNFTNTSTVTSEIKENSLNNLVEINNKSENSAKPKDNLTTENHFKSNDHLIKNLTLEERSDKIVTESLETMTSIFTSTQTISVLNHSDDLPNHWINSSFESGTNLQVESLKSSNTNQHSKSKNSVNHSDGTNSSVQSYQARNRLREILQSQQNENDGITFILPSEHTTVDSQLKMGNLYGHIGEGDPIIDLEQLSDDTKVDNEKTKTESAEEKIVSGDKLTHTNSSTIDDHQRKKHGSLGFLSGLFETMLCHRLGKFEIAYVILGIYIFIVAFVFLVFLCVNPREPRSRQEEELEKSRNITASFKFSAVVLMSLFLCLYVGIEVAVGQLLQTFAVKQYLQLPESTGYFMTYMFWGSFALARGLSIGLAARFSGLCLIFADLIICMVTSVLLVAGANKMEILLWIGVVILGFGMAPIFPASIAWIERYLPVNNKIASVFILGAALGQLTIPPVINLFINQEPMVLMYVNMVVNILCFVTFVGLWLLSSRQGEKYKVKVDRNIYQLANFDEVEDGLEMSYGNSHWQNNYNSHILMKKSAGKVT